MWVNRIADKYPDGTTLGYCIVLGMGLPDALAHRLGSESPMRKLIDLADICENMDLIKKDVRHAIEVELVIQEACLEKETPEFRDAYMSIRKEALVKYQEKEKGLSSSVGR